MPIPRTKLPGRIGIRTFVPRDPAITFPQRLNKVYWRVTFLSLKMTTIIPIGNGAVVYSADYEPISRCIQHMLHNKGFPVPDSHCKVDTCFICHPSNDLVRRKAA